MATPVKLHYVRSGGMANLRKEANVDTASLRASDPAAADRLEAAAATLLAEKKTSPAASPPDAFQHRVEITLGTQTTAVDAHDPVKSPALQALLAALGPFAKIAPR